MRSHSPPPTGGAMHSPVRKPSDRRIVTIFEGAGRLPKRPGSAPLHHPRRSAASDSRADEVGGAATEVSDHLSEVSLSTLSPSGSLSELSLRRRAFFGQETAADGDDDREATVTSLPSSGSVAGGWQEADIATTLVMARSPLTNVVRSSGAPRMPREARRKHQMKKSRWAKRRDPCPVSRMHSEVSLQGTPPQVVHVREPSPHIALETCPGDVGETATAASNSPPCPSFRPVTPQRSPKDKLHDVSPRPSYLLQWAERFPVHHIEEEAEEDEEDHSVEEEKPTVKGLLAKYIRKGLAHAENELSRRRKSMFLPKSEDLDLEKLRQEIAQQELDVGKDEDEYRLARVMYGNLDGAAIEVAESVQPRNPDFVDEGQTGIPVSDVHNYLLYCQMHRLTIVLRPVADGAAQAFIGTFGLTDPSLVDPAGYPILERTEYLPWSFISQVTCHDTNARGKTMATALKSSPYEPIKGMVPLNAQLSKVGAQQSLMKSSLEMALIQAEAESPSPPQSGSPSDSPPPSSPSLTGGRKLRSAMKGISPKSGSQRSIASSGGLTQVYAKLKSMETSAARLLDKIAEDSKKAMRASEAKLKKLKAQYERDSMNALNKRVVSEMYVDEFNQSQFLGECFARFGPRHEKIHFLVWRCTPEVEPHLQGMAYIDNDAPVFVLPPAEPDSRYRVWEKGDFVEAPLDFPPPDTEPVVVKLVASRVFYVSEKTGRIEEREEGAMLVPDYDGLSYAKDTVPPVELSRQYPDDDDLIDAWVEHYEEVRKEDITVEYRENMGLVSVPDIEHIEEVRSLTGWRQSHGEEANNTVKTQDFLPGNYVAFDSRGKLTILRSFQETIDFFSRMWRKGCPIRLNPNWNVILGSDWLPIIPSDSVAPLFDREGKEAAVLEKLKEQKTPEWDLSSLRAAYDRIFTRDVIEAWHGLPRNRDGRKATELSVWKAYVRHRDELKVMDLFFRIRKTLLYPPLYLNDWRGDEDPDTMRHVKRLKDLVPTVRELLRRRQHQMVLQLVEELTDQRRAFVEKHGTDSDDFLENIWDYMMTQELTAVEEETGIWDFGRPDLTTTIRSINDATVFSLQPAAQNQETRGYRSTSIGKSVSATSNMMYKAHDNKYYTYGQLQALRLLKKVGAVYGTSHNPWSEASRPLMMAARQAVLATQHQNENLRRKGSFADLGQTTTSITRIRRRSIECAPGQSLRDMAFSPLNSPVGSPRAVPLAGTIRRGSLRVPRLTRRPSWLQGLDSPRRRQSFPM